MMLVQRDSRRYPEHPTQAAGVGSPAVSPRRIALFCPGLGLGGSERQLVNLAIGLRSIGHHVFVVVLYTGEALEGELHKAQIPIVDLAKRSRLGAFCAMWRLLRFLRQYRIEILYSFHGLPNLLAPLAKTVVTGLKVAVGVRASSGSNVGKKILAPSIALKAEAILAKRADLVVTNSSAGKSWALSRGYPINRIRVVANGIDTDKFRPSHDGALRYDLGVDNSAIIVGMAARIDPAKDHETFFRAACLAIGSLPDLHFVCAWDGNEGRQKQLEKRAEVLGLSGNLSWIRGNFDLRTFYSAIDVFVLASISEGFPNTVAEAMACGTPCVVTDVGDASVIVGDVGVVVPPRDPDALAKGIVSLLDRLRRDGQNLRDRARDRVASKFSITAMVEQTWMALQP